ncbi:MULTISPECIES: YgdI/YgdR family lipoprotein [Pseudomonas aeruginosa group]|uniref:YgdI/YgdR family lipoprotein n=1 Tax=Pseudomonas aeruginosa group TaxID=136841 RepID=UPI0009A3B827|nr:MULTISPECIES: YgdI/YgdR family lipoprotein [Pseudomonas aeruginosa group]MBI7404904.1 YgdI/YgdR family lipoprotein [Pseudomonas aeruginosa]MDF3931892.1 YgdI/YgdR family lipoprotein [Pseudomonas citronellolis]MDI4074696.1 YgdI/YgdR family lipoprotein [Pseudomonas aeruginosa]MDU0677976.1 YgdI/YgdR family lipoprotein [Pseudomonas aeruginosa]MDV7888907.1 YgdI/YgdR family lipoprotein [Pseudomonas aeruginosa]
MKNLIAAILCTFTLSACSTEYLIMTNDGQVLTTADKPRLDNKTGMLEFKDSQGKNQQIPQSSVKQLIER